MRLNSRKTKTHCPVHFDRRGWEDGGVVEVKDNIPQFSLDLLVIHPLTGRGNICNNSRKLCQVRAYTVAPTWMKVWWNNPLIQSNSKEWRISSLRSQPLLLKKLGTTPKTFFRGEKRTEESRWKRNSERDRNKEAENERDRERQRQKRQKKGE